MAELHYELFHLGSYDNIYKSDSLWSEELNAAMRREVEDYVNAIVFDENGGVYELYTASFTIAPPEIAALYGAESSSAAGESSRIELDSSERAGLLTLSGVLSRDTEIAQSSPIHRGVFINTDICAAASSPPDDVSGLPQQEAGVTNRERVEPQHRCRHLWSSAVTRNMINPPGYAFERL